MADTGGSGGIGWIEQSDVFISGENGYHTYRIPALVLSSAGTVLAFCEERRHSRSDAGEIELMLRRSRDGGGSWEEQQVVLAEAGMTCGNPCPVVERETGVIWLPFCKNLADGPQKMIEVGKAPRTVWLIWSEDDGRTWAEPKEITRDVKEPSWTWYATGPGHGIQLRVGRLLVPCDQRVGVHFEPRREPVRSHVILGDDGGRHWRIGALWTRARTSARLWRPWMAPSTSTVATTGGPSAVPGRGVWTVVKPPPISAGTMPLWSRSARRARFGLRWPRQAG